MSTLKVNLAVSKIIIVPSLFNWEPVQLQHLQYHLHVSICHEQHLQQQIQFFEDIYPGKSV